MTLFEKWYAKTAFLAVFFVFGIASGIWIVHERAEACIKNYTFINASVVCGKSSVIKKTGYAETQAKIEAFIEEKRVANKITETAVYFRDLKNGPVFGIKETAEFAPASLLKLPLALAYLDEAERNPALLAQTLAFEDTGQDIYQSFLPSETITEGRAYSVEELLRRMLAYSDNLAYELVETHLVKTYGENILKDAYLELGIIAPEDIYTEAISVRRYASIFRVLYNVSFLTPEYSEKALSWLTASDFKIGLIAGTPKNIRIAHKFGERFTKDGVKQLHDCGIVYYPENPYLLCVMTRGDDFNELAAVIATISKEVYEEVDSRRL
ncbi:MAG: serine hydrolase [Parcubacteria group bacterium]|nr:serine hydrolase [Parcubacteria group bacterium]